jgi:serine/threonine protein kinase
MALATGTRLGPYEILSPIGEGAMGQIYKARDSHNDRLVAIKILPDLLAGDAQFRDRFAREGKAIAALSHPNICAVYDVGREGRTDFLVLEYLEGETLAERLTRARAETAEHGLDAGLPIAEAIQIAIQIASALERAHRSGIVHRDLKPANIFLAKPGGSGAAPVAKLLDFGLARASTSRGSSKPAPPLGSETPIGTVLGTFQYMAPEQLAGRDVDARADLFALGAVLYEMITGNKAFFSKRHASLLDTVLQHPPPASSIRGVTPPALDRMIDKCLATDPNQRWQSAAELREALTNLSV